MTAILAVGRFLVDACILFAATFIALVVYTLYAQNPTIVNSIYCNVNTSSDLGYTACMIANR